MAKNVVLWLEDRPETVVEQIAYCEQNGLIVEIASTDHAFVDKLRENQDRICLIVVDVMLYGVPDLTGIGLEDSSTDGGWEAGWVILLRFLRPEQEVEHATIPVLVLSTRPFSKKDMVFQRNLADRAAKFRHGPLGYLEKGDLDETGERTWRDDFRKFVDEVVLRTKK